ncbi:MAG: tetratricopeptide repeat protein [Acidobacteriota bacterium]
MKRLFGVFCVSGLLFAAGIDRGVELYKQGKYAEAESELRGAVGENEESSRAHRLLGLAMLEQKKYDEAAAQLNRAAELEPGGESKGALARLYAEKKEFDRVEPALDGASGEDADYARALMLLQRKQYEEAAQLLETYTENNPNHAYAHYYAGMAYNGSKRKDKMLSHFELFLRLNPDAPEARKVRAVLQTGH